MVCLRTSHPSSGFKTRVAAEATKPVHAAAKLGLVASATMIVSLIFEADVPLAVIRTIERRLGGFNAHGCWRMRRSAGS